MYKIVNNRSPEYLSNLLPSVLGDTHQYNLRNNTNIRNFNCRTALFSKSFFPSTISLWNNLDPLVKNSTTINEFTFKVKKKYTPPQPPIWYSLGDRKLSVILCKLRNNCSNLNDDLYHSNLSNSRSCSCGVSIEHTFHFFFECQKYDRERRILFESLRTLDLFPITLDILLSGNIEKTSAINKQLLEAVLLFIQQTKRFS